MHFSFIGINAVKDSKFIVITKARLASSRHFWQGAAVASGVAKHPRSEAQGAAAARWRQCSAAFRLLNNGISGIAPYRAYFFFAHLSRCAEFCNNVLTQALLVREKA